MVSFPLTNYMVLQFWAANETLPSMIWSCHTLLYFYLLPLKLFLDCVMLTEAALQPGAWTPNRALLFVWESSVSIAMPCCVVCCCARDGRPVLCAAWPGPWFNMKMSSYQYRKSHCGDKTVVRSSYLHNGISYTGKITSLYWFGPLVPLLVVLMLFSFGLGRRDGDCP